MIAPLPQHAVAPRIADRAPGDSPKPVEESFADMLAAPALVGSRPIARVAPDHGPAIVSVLEPVAEPALTDPRDPVATRPHVEPNAHVFNRDGFFGTGVGPDVAAEPEAVTAPAPPIAAPDAIAPSPALDPAEAFAIIADAALPLRPRPAAGASPSLARTATLAKTGTMGALSAQKPDRLSEVREEEAAPVAFRRQAREPGKARNALHVALHELEQGLQVAVRVEALDRAERERIQHDIAALLSRHGLSARVIRILAPLERNLPDRNAK